MAVPRTLPLGQFASNTEPYILVEGALAALGKLELKRDQRSNVWEVERKYKAMGIQITNEIEDLWLRLEDIMEEVLPDYTVLDGNKVVPDWTRLKLESTRAAVDLAPEVGGVRVQTKHAPPYVLEVHAEDATLYRKQRIGRGHRWVPVWTVPASEFPADKQAEEPVDDPAPAGAE